MRPAPRSLAALLLLACATPGLACGPAPGGDPGLVLRVAVSPTPAMVGPGRVVVTLADEAGTPIGGATVVLSGRRPAGDPVVDTAHEQAPGSYAAGAFPFDAPGDWSLAVHARLADGRQTTADHPIRVVGRP